MINNKSINDYLNDYCKLRDRQYAVYTRYAKKHCLTTNELFVLDIIWFAKNGLTQKEICERLSMNKQTANAIINKFLKLGYVEFKEIETDRRNKNIIFTSVGKIYAENIIPPAANADNKALEELPFCDIKKLVELTAKFTESMERHF